jgi:hypothetical protein
MHNLHYNSEDIKGLFLQFGFQIAIQAYLLLTSFKGDSKLAYVEIWQKALCSNQTLNGVTIEYNMRKPFGLIAEMTQKDDWRSLV